MIVDVIMIANLLKTIIFAPNRKIPAPKVVIAPEKMETPISLSDSRMRL